MSSSSGKGQSILEKWLEDMPNSNQTPVKKEKRRDFVDDLLASPANTSVNLFSYSPSVSLAPSLPSTFPSSSSSSSHSSLPSGFQRPNINTSSLNSVPSNLSISKVYSQPENYHSSNCTC